MKRIKWTEAAGRRDIPPQVEERLALDVLEKQQLWTMAGDTVIVRDSPRTVFVAKIVRSGVLEEE